jgi:pimeloyl-ACP methyl ester carboxylesterase
MSRSRKFGAVALAAGLVAVGFVSPATAVTRKGAKPKKQRVVAQNADGVYQFPKRTVKWTVPAPIKFVGCFSGLECALVETPMNYADPLSPALEISVVRRRASNPAARLGVLFVNPGGPGASSSGLIRAAERVFTPEMLARFDIVGVDPRGTTNSAPVSCGIDPLDARNINTATDELRLLAKSCAKQSGQLLKYIDTESAVRDHDWVRQSMGEAQVNFLGFSYGGYLGAMYAQLFPATLRSVVLDSGLDHTRFGTGLLAEGYASQERSLNVFLQQCANGTFTPCPFNDGTDLLAKFDKLMAYYGDPATQSYRRKLPRANFESVVERLLQNQGSGGWKLLAEGLQKASTSPGDPLRSINLGNVQSARSYEVVETILAYQCRDGFMTQEPGAMRQLAAQAPTIAPHFQVTAGLSAELYEVCSFWPQKTKFAPPIQPNGIAPVLLIGATLDSVTPIEWQQSMVATTGGTLLTRVGADHGQLGRSSCVDAAADAFVTTLALPPAGTICPN